MSTDLLYQLALGDVPHIGNTQAKTLCEHFGTAHDIFRASQASLEKIENIGEVRARSIKKFSNFKKAEKELAFIHKYDIKPIFFRDEDYPKRLLNCADPPVLLFYKGIANLNAPKIVSIVGTRKNSTYGEQTTEKIIEELKNYDVLIVSGLAYGIDSIAHKSALKNGLDTVGVVGHGLDRIYPPQNAGLAKEMIMQGGILTEFKSKTNPDKYNFPSRNRIVAGISDVTIVIETRNKGGSLITAELANDYNRDVFAVPGRISDAASYGCNKLIAENKAALLSSPKGLVNALGWQETVIKKSHEQIGLFTELSELEKQAAEMIRREEQLSIDQLNLLCGVSASTLANALLNLELKNIVRSMPGKRYRMV